MKFVIQAKAPMKFVTQAKAATQFIHKANAAMKFVTQANAAMKFVIPAQAGIQGFRFWTPWVPAGACHRIGGGGNDGNVLGSTT